MRIRKGLWSEQSGAALFSEYPVQGQESYSTIVPDEVALTQAP